MRVSDKTIQEMIKDFSSQVPADLIVQTTENNISGINYFTEYIIKVVKKFFINPVDWQYGKANKIINGSFGGNCSLYLMDKFRRDHLRKFEYKFQLECLFDICSSDTVILDIGGGTSYSTVVSLLACPTVKKIITADINSPVKISKYQIEFLRSDCTDLKLPGNSTDIVTVISTLEHIGLGRYGDTIDPGGDIKTMKEVRRVLRKGGYAIVTIPYGYPTIVYNLHRIYDSGRVAKLCAGFNIVKEGYSYLGKRAMRKDVEGKKAVKEIPGFYEDVPDDDKIWNAPGGIMLLLRKK